jgi:adenylate cyclase
VELLKLQLLGDFRARDGAGGTVEVSTRKGRGLLTFLALQPAMTAPRERLASLLWGDRGEAQARSSLRQTLTVLRRELGAGIIGGDEERVELLATVSDANEFRELAGATAAAELRKAVSLFGGDLLSDSGLTDQVFEEWLLAERATLQDLMLQTLERLLQLETGAGRIAAAKRLVALDPLREASHRALIGAYLAVGEKGLAQKQFEACKVLLKRELGVEPAAETLELGRATSSAEAGTGTIPPAERSQGVPAVPLVERGELSVAVLPFTNLGSDPEQQHFVDGLTEDLITDLSKVPSLFVIAAQTSFRFRDEPDPATMGRELGVRHVVHGSVRRMSGDLRLNAQLVDAMSGAVVWAERFDRDVEGIYLVQTELAARIAERVVGAAFAPPPERYRPASVEAQELVMLGRQEWRHSDEAGTRAAPLFKRAIELDPGYSEAYRWLAHGQFMSWLFFNGPVQSARSQSLVNARKAVACDPGDAAAHSVLAIVLNYQREWDAASNEIDLALRLNPNESETWSILSDLRVMEGRGRDAVRCAQRAFELNPRPLGYFYWLLGQAQIAAGDLNAAVITLRREETYRSLSRRLLAAALAMLGRLEEAREEARLFMAASPHFTISHWIETQPFRDLSMRERFVQAYRKAGLPE